MKVKYFLTTVLFIVTFSTMVKGQEINETLVQLSEAGAVPYVKPLVEAFGSNLNSGWVSQVPSATIFGLNFEFKIIASGSFFNDKPKTFSNTGLFRFNGSQADAIVGSKDENLKILFPGGDVSGVTLDSYLLNLTDVKGVLGEFPLLPSPAIQLSFGNILGTKISARYVPDIDIQDVGKFSYWGIGFMHNPFSWLPLSFPVDVGLGYFYQRMNIGTIFESSAMQYGLFASTTIGSTFAIIPFAGFTFESSETKVNYFYEYEEIVGGLPRMVEENIAFTINGNNTSSFIGGVTFKLAFVHLSVDYKMANTKTVTAGLSFVF